MAYDKFSAERKKLQSEGLIPEWYTTGSWQLFKSKYAVEGESAVKGRFETISKTLSDYLPEEYKETYRQKFFDVLWKGWLSPSTPILANCGTNRGMSVACSGGVVGDSVDSFYDSLHEQAILSKWGFGCSADMSSIRSRGSKISNGGKADGVMPVIDTFADMTAKISQGGTRRGSTASYVDIETGDFDEIISALEKNPDGLNVGWIVRDSFIEKLKSGDDEANRRYVQSEYTKLVTGKGYFFFIDKVNRARPLPYVNNNLFVKASNLCSEITLYSDDGEQGTFDSDEGGHTFSCVLSSMNVSKYDEWKDTDATFTATVFLDCVVSHFLKQSYGVNGLQRIHRFTRKSRPIGLGVLGFQTYLHMNMIPYESLDAFYVNDAVFKNLHEGSLKATKWLAEVLGEPLWCKGTGLRNSHRIAAAPTKSTANLMGGVSESFSPEPGMAWVQNSAAGEINRVSPVFLELLKKKKKYNKDIIKSIIENMGSCQHLDFLSQEERDVFKTAFEIDQNVLLRYAAHRQKHYIDQAQSINGFFSEDGDEERISAWHRDAFLNENIHSLYYLYSRSGVTISSSCVACEA